MSTTAADVGRYADEMFALIESWRSEWHDDFPFYYVELAPFTYFGNGRAGPKKADSPDREALFWEAANRCLADPPHRNGCYNGHHRRRA